MYVFWNIDFGRISEGFWKGFGKPKSSIFAFFSLFFRCKFWSATWKGNKSKKIAARQGPSSFLLIFPLAAAVRAGLGGRILGWGEGKLGLNFKPGLKIGL